MGVGRLPRREDLQPGKNPEVVGAWVEQHELTLVGEGEHAFGRGDERHVARQRAIEPYPNGREVLRRQAMHLALHDADDAVARDDRRVHVRGEARSLRALVAVMVDEACAVVLRADHHSVSEHERRGHVEVTRDLRQDGPESLARRGVPATEALRVEADDLPTTAVVADDERRERRRTARCPPDHVTGDGIESHHRGLGATRVHDQSAVDDERRRADAPDEFRRRDEVVP